MIAAVVLALAASAGDTAFRTGDFAQAQQAYAVQWQSDRNDVDAAVGLARLALYDNRFDQARRWIAIAQALAPNDARAGTAAHVLAERTDPNLDRVASHAGPARATFVQTDPLPIVQATINGRSARLLIDTGAPSIVLDSRFAAALGIAASGTQQGTFAGGKHAQVLEASVRRLEVGGWSISDVPASILPVRDIMGERSPIEGIIGTGLFSRFLTTVDYRSGALILRDPDDSAAFEREAAVRGATIVPMWLVGDHFIFVRARAGTGPSGLFNVDTGGTFGVQLTQEAIEAAGITLASDDTRSGVGGGGATAFVPFQTNVALGSLVETGVDGVYTPQGNQYGIFPFDVTGTISHEFFRKTTLTFDFRAMRLVIESG